MAVAEKSGMVINAEKEVIGWVNAGEEVDLRDGDMIVSHHKTAEKMGLADMFKEQKAANAPVKEKVEKEPGEKKERAPRAPKVDLTDDQTFTVLKADFKGTTEEGERGDCFKNVLGCSTVGQVRGLKGYTHTKKDGTSVDYSAETVLRYLIKRGAVTVDA